MNITANKTSIISLCLFSALVAKYAGGYTKTPGFEIDIPTTDLLTNLLLIISIYFVAYLARWYTEVFPDVYKNTLNYKYERELWQLTHKRTFSPRFLRMYFYRKLIDPGLISNWVLDVQNYEKKEIISHERSSELQSKRFIIYHMGRGEYLSNYVLPSSANFTRQITFDILFPIIVLFYALDAIISRIG